MTEAVTEKEIDKEGEYVEVSDVEAVIDAVSVGLGEGPRRRLQTQSRFDEQSSLEVSVLRYKARP